METKRFIVEIGTGADLHGEDVTKAACRAVKDAISRSCLCGLVELMGIADLQAIKVDILVACPRPDEVDLEQVKAKRPSGRKPPERWRAAWLWRGCVCPILHRTVIKSSWPMRR